MSNSIYCSTTGETKFVSRVEPKCPRKPDKRGVKAETAAFSQQLTLQYLFSFVLYFEGCCHNRDKRTWNVNISARRGPNLFESVCPTKRKRITTRENRYRSREREREGQCHHVNLVSRMGFCVL